MKILTLYSTEPLEFDDFDGDDDAIDLRAYHILGGVFYFDLLHLPPQPKNVKNWVITQSKCKQYNVKKNLTM